MNIRICKGGFPHSEIPGSKVIRTSSGLIAAYHVFHSLCAPRHSLNALVTLDSSDFLEMVTSTYRPYIAVTNKIVWRSCAVNNTFFPRLDESWESNAYPHMSICQTDFFTIKLTLNGNDHLKNDQSGADEPSINYFKHPPHQKLDGWNLYCVEINQNLGGA